MINAVRKMRSVEEAALAIVIELLPVRTTGRQLVELMNEHAPPTPERVASIELAVESLIAVGLLVQERYVLRPTPAAIRCAELDLGLSAPRGRSGQRTA